MKKEMPVGVAAFGWLFIISSILSLILIPKTINTFQKLFQISQQIPVNESFIFGLSLLSTIIGFLRVFLILIVGIGLLKVKPWAYYLTIIISVSGLVNIGWNVWFFGPQIFTPLQIILSVLICMAIILYFIRRKTRDTFKVNNKGFKKLRVILKVFIILLIAAISLRILSIPLWTGYTRINLSDKLPLINLRPEKTEHKITDEEFILKKCEKINLANMSIYLPKEWQISQVAYSNELGWDLIFLHEKKDKMEAFVLFNSRGSQAYFGAISKVLKFDSVYGFERKINYATHSPLYSTIKILSSPRELTVIEEGMASSWRGFIKIHKQKERNRIIFENSLHSLDKKESAGFTLILDKDHMTAKQARNIIASFRFEDTIEEADASFERGKKRLSKEEYKKAALNFANAYAQNSKNPEYSYYLALSLYEDRSEAGRKTRLISSGNFLEEALELTPGNQKVERLFSLVNQEIEQIEDYGKE